MVKVVLDSVSVTGVDDEVTAADAYGNAPAAVVEKLESVTSEEEKQASSSTKETKPSDASQPIAEDEIQPLEQDATTTKKDKTVSDIKPTAEEKRLFTAIAGNDTTPAMQKMAAGYMRELNGDPKQTSALFKDGEQLLSISTDTKKTTVTSLAKGVSRLENTSTFANLQNDNAVLAVSMTYLNMAIALGIPELIDKSYAKIQEEKRAKQVLIESTRSVIKRGDINTLDIIIGYIGGEGVLARVPDAIKLLISSYKRPVNLKPIPAQTQLIATLSAIKSNWREAQHNDEVVDDLDIFEKPSNDFIYVMLSNSTNYDDYIAPILTGPKFKRDDVKRLIKGYYPNVGL